MSRPNSTFEPLRVILKIARAAQNTYVGRHWPDKAAMRRDGIGFGLNDGEHEDRIRRFLYECQPEFLVQYLEAAIKSSECSVSSRDRAQAALAEALALLDNLAGAVTALENRSVRSSGEFHVWAEERMVTEARDEARAFLAAHGAGEERE